MNNVGGVPELSSSPGRIDPTNTAFNASRKPLAGEFTFNGHRLFVIANHFNSKGGDNPLFGRFQPPVFSSEVQRHQQAQIVNNFVDAILAIDPNANVVVLPRLVFSLFPDSIRLSSNIGFSYTGPYALFRHRPLPVCSQGETAYLKPLKR